MNIAGCMPSNSKLAACVPGMTGLPRGMTVVCAMTIRHALLKMAGVRRSHKDLESEQSLDAMRKGVSMYIESIHLTITSEIDAWLSSEITDAIAQAKALPAPALHARPPYSKQRAERLLDEIMESVVRHLMNMNPDSLVEEKLISFAKNEPMYHYAQMVRSISATLGASIGVDGLACIDRHFLARDKTTGAVSAERPPTNPGLLDAAVLFRLLGLPYSATNRHANFQSLDDEALSAHMCDCAECLDSRTGRDPLLTLADVMVLYGRQLCAQRDALAHAGPGSALLVRKIMANLEPRGLARQPPRLNPKKLADVLLVPGLESAPSVPAEKAAPQNEITTKRAELTAQVLELTNKVSTLSKTNEAVTAERDGLAKSLADAGAAAQASQDEMSDAERSLRARLFCLENALQSAKEQGADVPEQACYDGWDQLEQFADRELAGRVLLTARSIRAARDSDYQDPGFAFESLRMLAQDYVPARRGEPGAYDRLTASLKRLRMQMGPIGEAILNHRTKAQYMVTHGGVRLLCDLHLQGSSARDPRKGFRLYFTYVCPKDAPHLGYVVVGSFPNHLDNSFS